MSSFISTCSGRKNGLVASVGLLVLLQSHKTSVYEDISFHRDCCLIVNRIISVQILVVVYINRMFSRAKRAKRDFELGNIRT